MQKDESFRRHLVDCLLDVDVELSLAFALSFVTLLQHRMATLVQVADLSSIQNAA